MAQKHDYSWRIIPSDKTIRIFVDLKTLLAYFDDLGFTPDDFEATGESIDGFLFRYHELFGGDRVTPLKETSGTVIFVGEYNYLYNDPDKIIVESLTAMLGPREIE